MFDLSPEKLMVLLALGVVVLGPQRLPTAARTLASALMRVRSLADSVAQPVHDSLQEPRRVFNDALADVRTSVRPRASSAGRVPAPTPVDVPGDPNDN